MVIAIGGVSRSGKTKLTKMIKELLGEEEVYTMCQDDYAYPIPEIPKIKELTDWECPASINFIKLKKDLKNAIDNHNHVILEGFLAFHDLNLNKLYDRSIFFNISKEVFVERRLRDTRWEREPNWYIDYVWESYLTYGSIPKGYEALILDGTLPISEDRLLDYLSTDISE
jgi:uridine kinase